MKLNKISFGSKKYKLNMQRDIYKKNVYGFINIYVFKLYLNINKNSWCLINIQRDKMDMYFFVCTCRARLKSMSYVLQIFKKFRWFNTILLLIKLGISLFSSLKLYIYMYILILNQLSDAILDISDRNSYGLFKFPAVMST